MLILMHTHILLPPHKLPIRILSSDSQTKFKEKCQRGWGRAERRCLECLKSIRREKERRVERDKCWPRAVEGGKIKSWKGRKKGIDIFSRVRRVKRKKRDGKRVGKGLRDKPMDRGLFFHSSLLSRLC